MQYKLDGHLNSLSHTDERVALPLPPHLTEEHHEEMEIYARFMRHLRHVPNNRMEIKILSAIQFTADMLDYSDAHIAKVLVELGLCAPRMAFPAAFLSYADQVLMRSNATFSNPSQELSNLKGFWDTIGESKLAAFKASFIQSEEPINV
jgi:hypothetical protein